jgi:hypothetical protein
VVVKGRLLERMTLDRMLVDAETTARKSNRWHKLTWIGALMAPRRNGRTVRGSQSLSHVALVLPVVALSCSRSRRSMAHVWCQSISKRIIDWFLSRAPQKF